jgi:hypothetical protein
MFALAASFVASPMVLGKYDDALLMLAVSIHGRRGPAGCGSGVLRQQRTRIRPLNNHMQWEKVAKREREKHILTETSSRLFVGTTLPC